jgi:hypothetical protein
VGTALYIECSKIYLLISAFETATSNLAERTIKRCKATAVRVPSVRLDSSGFVTYKKIQMNLSDYIRYRVRPYYHMATEGQRLDDMDTTQYPGLPLSRRCISLSNYYYEFVTCLIAHQALGGSGPLLRMAGMSPIFY